ncbi:MULTISPECIES: uracil phosphoribosyltransferase [Flavobacterium]|uniref:Uracil phosphoribosyltransferase n=1 Tax=Flavobacterium supellecticarium TaxID=2565924 RepID=A0A4S3ZQ31_9FLAO|nr:MULTISPECIES: uracil phosphoribosyltransferase [Flavobacterium]THF47635.1 uracil phosphoribosyltransferase [Flavobacterium supellecticarium]HRB72222.1 uracil phosphoribosyltransferase [Flavobacterium sp.]
MKAFFEGIQYLFVDILFAPMDLMRKLELSNWWAANLLNWIFIIICCGATYYWIKELKKHKDSGEDSQDTTAHSFLK